MTTISMRVKLTFYAVLGVFLGTALYSCSDSGSNSIEDEFDRTAFLTQMAEGIILPSYVQLDADLAGLQTSIQALTTDLTSSRLQDAQGAWITAYTSWQYTNAFNFGPAGPEGLQRGLNEEIGTFPVNTELVEERITNGTTNLQDFARDARGMLVIEYLLFGENLTAEQVLTSLSDSNRRAYLTAVLNDTRARVTAVLNAWNGEFLSPESNGATPYLTTFISNNGTDAGSSTSVFYNEFVKSFEAKKNFKLGLPLGLRAGQTQAEPGLVEARYSGKSLEMIKHDFESVKMVWAGLTKDGTDILGFKEYLSNVSGGEELIASTEAQLNAVDTQLSALDLSRSLSRGIEQNPQDFVPLHTEFQKLTRFLKSDLSSLLGIAITFSSGDGD